jgi:hypothetical protein
MPMKVVHKKYLGIDISKQNNTNYSAIEEIARSRLKIVTHYSLFGLASTLDAFCVSKRSLYRWKKTLELSHGDWKSLIPTSTNPKKRNTRFVDYRILTFIQQTRMQQVVGHRKLYHMLKPHCENWGISLPSITTLSRVVKTMKEHKQILSNDQVVYYAKTGKIKRIKKSSQMIKLCTMLRLGKSKESKRKTIPKLEGVSTPLHLLEMNVKLIQ